VTSTEFDSTAVDVTAALAALAEPTRLRIVGVLRGAPRCVCDVLETVDIAPNLLSYHLRVLREAGLIVASRRGRWVDYHVDEAGFAALWDRLAEAGVPVPSDTPALAGVGR
jgi:ArsR family transcriptional regulator, arsenate/arsenite/antimonite-responsive transcriptional repressor